MKKFKPKQIIYTLVIIVVTTITIDLIRIFSYKTFPQKPNHKINSGQNQLYYDLVNGKQKINWNQLDGTLEFIQNEYDCSDFRLVNLIRILYEYENQIPQNILNDIEKTLFNFRYWWDEPGENSMCYWSENHQILFASAEYLIGQKYPQVVFPNSGLSGKEHTAKARKRALDWLEMRWKYGFTEFNSEVYYKEDIGALLNFIDFADDNELLEKSKIILDLLFYDVATQNIKTMFVSASGRAYEGNRKGGPNVNLNDLTNYFWKKNVQLKPGITYGIQTTRNYSLPPVLLEIARDTCNVVLKQSNGLDISELQTEGYFGTDNRSMMMQWGMECFTNPEIVRNSVSHIRKHNMFSNSFISDFRWIDFSFIRFLHLEPLLIRLTNPQPNGVAIQRGNTYTFKTKDFSLYSIQSYHPGMYGDQHHVNGMNIGNSFSVFHTHPAVEADIKKQSPDYWVGYGHLPYVAQDSSVSLAIYNIPPKKGFMEEALLDYTHAYFPKDKFDSVYVNKNYAFGKKGDTYCAIITRNALHFRDNTTDDLLQPGKQTFWIIEAGSKDQDESYSNFCNRVKNNLLNFEPQNLVLNYTSKQKNYKLEFKADFWLNDKKIDVNYDRFESPYSTVKRKPKTVQIKFNNKSLYLDFYNIQREF